MKKAILAFAAVILASTAFATPYKPKCPGGFICDPAFESMSVPTMTVEQGSTDPQSQEPQWDDAADQADDAVAAMTGSGFPLAASIPPPKKCNGLFICPPEVAQRAALGSKGVHPAV
jgi:hypothetical protein